MALLIPVDEPAEREVVGTVVASPEGYRLADAVVAPADFYVPRYGRAFAACAGLDDVGRSWDSSERIGPVAGPAEVDEAELRRLVRDRSFFHDVNAHFARRVADAARRRRAMEVLAAAFNLLGQGATLEEAAAIVNGGPRLRLFADTAGITEGTAA